MKERSKPKKESGKRSFTETEERWSFWKEISAKGIETEKKTTRGDKERRPSLQEKEREKTNLGKTRKKPGTKNCKC